MSLGTVIFSHGKESGPQGTKITALSHVAREQGFHVESVDYTDISNPDARAQRLVERSAGKARPLVLVGSSMGGYVATVASPVLRPAGLFLMAPAFYLPGYANQEPVSGARQAMIVHGLNDEVVPAAVSVRFTRCNRASLFLVDGDHALTGQLSFLEELFGLFLERLAGTP
ncbi:MAG: alpha/beta hydrolase [Desulfuromonadales bacterium]|nr:MAG: alpha/beta hydrolase [Desulfuromonadales bacterium]